MNTFVTCYLDRNESLAQTVLSLLEPICETVCVVRDENNYPLYIHGTVYYIVETNRVFSFFDKLSKAKAINTDKFNIAFLGNDDNVSIGYHELLEN